MIYILFVFLLVLFVLCYFFSGKDLFAPAVIQLLTFAGSVFMCILFMWSMNAFHEFHWETIIIIASAMSLTSVIGISTHRLFQNFEHRGYTEDTKIISPISAMVSLLTVVVILLTIGWLFMEIHRIGGHSGSFFDIMNRFHALNSYSIKEEGRLPNLLNHLIRFLDVTIPIYGFNFIYFYNKLTVKQKILNLLIIGLTGLGLLLTGGRSELVYALLAWFIIFHFLRTRRLGGYSQYSLKNCLKIFTLLILVLIGFFVTKSFVGRSSRNEVLNLVDYIAYYTGTQYIALDEFLQRPPAPSGIWGKETFYGLINGLSKRGLIDIQPYIVHLEFRPVGAGLRNNVYTGLRNYYYDFGVIGMYILHSLSMIFLSFFYEYQKKKASNLGILTFSIFYYVPVMTFFAARFYSFFSLSFALKLILIIMFYELFIRKRIRLKFRRTAYMLQPIPIQQESHTADS